ncbi:MAG: TonB family protein [Bdellovibrionota bacterium]|nr:MAG: TonB family protein [Bdellovibrionota bacterium]
MRGAQLKGFFVSLTAHTAVGVTVLTGLGTTPPMLLGSGMEGLSISYEPGLPGAGALSAPSLEASEESPPPLSYPELPAPVVKKVSPPKAQPVVKTHSPRPRVTNQNVATQAIATSPTCNECGSGQGEHGIGNGSGGGSGGVSGVAPVSVPKPPYPWAARRAGFEGRVLFDITIAPDGSVTEAQVAASSGRDDCDHAARRTILEQWRFQPATRFGRPVEWREQVAVVFRLR